MTTAWSRRGPRRPLRVLVVAMAVTLTACGDDWTADVEDAWGMVAGDDLVVTVFEAGVRAHDLEGELRWQRRLDNRDVFGDGPTRIFPMSVDVGGDLVAVLARDGRDDEPAWTVVAYDAVDGQQRWTAHFPEPAIRLLASSGATTDFTAGLAVTEDAVLVVSPSDEVVALDAVDGTERWRGGIEGSAVTGVTSLTAGSGLAVATDSLGVRGFALDDGEVLFDIAESNPSFRLPGVLIDDAVYLATHATVRAIDLDGHERWSAEVRDGPDGLGVLTQPALTPVLVDDVLVGAWRAQSREPILRAYDRDDGAIRWEQRDAQLPLGRQENPWEHPGTLLELNGVPAAATTDLRVLDPTDGSVSRVVRLDRELERGIALRDGALVYVGDDRLRSQVVSR